VCYKVYVKTREGALENYKEGFSVFVWHYRLWNFLSRRHGVDKVLDIHGFVDVVWAGDLDCRRYTSGHVFNLFGGEISWMRKRQYVAALSTTEVEYMAATHVRDLYGYIGYA
jgi:hypothetical protein